jgi:F-type H+-transporting ATPase subunit b
VTRSLFIVSALLWSAPVLAAGGGGQPEGWFTALAFHTFNLFLFVGAVAFLTRKMIPEALKNRAARIEKELDESNRLRREAQARYDELEARLNRFESEFNEMRADATRASDREVALIGERAETEVAQIKAGAEKAIRDEVNAARTALHQQAVTLALNVAEEQLRGRISAADQDRLAQDLLGTVKEANGHG